MAEAATTPANLTPRAVFRRRHVELEGILAKKVASAADVAGLLARLKGGHDAEQFLPCVSRALGLLAEGASGSFEGAEMLFAAMSRWALEALADSGPAAFPKEVMPWRGGTGAQEVAYPAAQCRGLLANAFFMNVLDTASEIKRAAGGLDFTEMLRSTRPLAAQKIACLLQYFEASRALGGTQEDFREVVVERRGWPGERGDLDEFRNWAMREGAERTVGAGTCMLHTSGMETAEDAEAFVNFANPNFGYGCFIPSCTQEEIMQVCCPEFNVGMLHVGCMEDAEAVNVRGVRRFSSYRGYLHSFEYVGPWTGALCVQAILTMDATMIRHFSEDKVLRDIRKACLCFQGCSVVSTGRWGCGAFGGHPAHKFAQQLVAAGLAGCSLRFSTFGDPARCDEVLAAVAAAQPSAADLLQAVLVASAAVRARAAKDFATALVLQLGRLSHAGEGATKDVGVTQPAGEPAETADAA